MGPVVLGCQIGCRRAIVAIPRVRETGRMQAPRIPSGTERDHDDGPAYLPWSWDEVAAHTFVLVKSWRTWVHRRVETIQIIDTESARRRLSVDFTMPRPDGRLRAPGVEMAGWGGHGADRTMALPVPLLTLDKSPLIDLDVRAADGTALPILTSEENGLVAVHMLARLGSETFSAMRREDPLAAEAILDVLSELPAAGKSTLGSIHEQGSIRDNPVDEAIAAYEALFLDPERTGRAYEILRGDTELRNFAWMLTRQFVLIALVPIPTDERTVVKVGYDMQLRQRGPRAFSRTAVSLGLAPRNVELDMRGVLDSGSHHVEVQAPPGMAVAGLYAESFKGSREHGVFFSGPPASKVHELIRGINYEPTGSGDAGLHAETGTLILDLRAQPSAIVVPTVVLALLMFVIFATGLIGDLVFDIKPQDDSPVAILLLLPTLFVLWLVRPGEHAMLARSLMGFRVIQGALGVVSLAVAGSMASTTTHSFRVALWSGAACAALVAALIGAMALRAWSKLGRGEAV